MLDLPARRRIFDFVREHPGSSARTIQRGLGLGWGETAYHLDQMLRGGLLCRERGGRRDYYFPREMLPLDRQLLVAMQSVAERAILVELARFPGLTFRELVDRLAVGKSTMAFHLKFLVALGLVEVDSSGPTRRYRAHRPELILRLYGTYRDSFEARWIDRFASTWGGLTRK
ncbi:MAG: MarR family transcriptional regulator [Thermoplasmata archaeon]